MLNFGHIQMRLRTIFSSQKDGCIMLTRTSLSIMAAMGAFIYGHWFESFHCQLGLFLSVKKCINVLFIFSSNPPQAGLNGLADGSSPRALCLRPLL
jgi:hypothetical protein